MSSAAEQAQARQVTYAETFNMMQGVMGVQDADGQPTYRDIHEWLELQYKSPEAQATLVGNLQALEAECRQVLNLGPGGYTTAVPDKNSLVTLSSGEQELTVFKLRVWQLDYQRAGQVKSGASLHAVRDSMHKNLVGQGNETAKYPANYSAALLSHDGIEISNLKVSDDDHEAW